MNLFGSIVFLKKTYIKIHGVKNDSILAFYKNRGIFDLTLDGRGISIFDFLFKSSRAKYLSASVGGLGRTIKLVFVGWAYDV